MFRRGAVAIAVTVLIVGCSAQDTLAAIPNGACFEAEGVLTLDAPVTVIDCSQPHRNQKIGTAQLLGSSVSAEKPTEAAEACRSISFAQLGGRNLPEGSSLQEVFDRRSSGNVRNSLICVVSHRRERTGGI